MRSATELKRHANRSEGDPRDPCLRDPSRSKIKAQQHKHQEENANGDGSVCVNLSESGVSTCGMKSWGEKELATVLRRAPHNSYWVYNLNLPAAAIQSSSHNATTTLTMMLPYIFVSLFERYPLMSLAISFSLCARCFRSCSNSIREALPGTLSHERAPSKTWT